MVVVVTRCLSLSLFACGSPPLLADFLVAIMVGSRYLYEAVVEWASSLFSTPKLNIDQDHRRGAAGVGDAQNGQATLVTEHDSYTSTPPLLTLDHFQHHTDGESGIISGSISDGTIQVGSSGSSSWLPWMSCFFY